MQEVCLGNTMIPVKFGMGFLKEINKTVMQKDNATGVTQNVGLRYNIASLIDGDAEALVTILDIGNKWSEPRFTKAAIEEAIDDEETNIDEVVENVLGFLETANATRRITVPIREAVREEEERQAKIKEMLG